MSEKTDVDDLNLSDAELLEVLKNHGIDRRNLMKVLGVGAGVAALGGTAGGKKGRGARIDKVFGKPYADSEKVPSGLVDHVVGLHVQPGDGAHEGFPAPDGDDPDDQDDVPEFFFDPVGLHVKPGEIVQFDNHHGLHTVTSFHPKYSEPPFFTAPHRIPTEYGFTAPPYVGGESWLYKFTKKGVYDLLCLPHLSLGMVMRIVVFDPDEDSLSDSTFDDWGPLPEIPSADAVLTDPALNPANIVTEGEVAWSNLTL